MSKIYQNMKQMIDDYFENTGHSEALWKIDALTNGRPRRLENFEKKSRKYSFVKSDKEGCVRIIRKSAFC